MTTKRTRQQEGAGEERPQSRGAPIFLVLMMLVCCGLPFLVITAGSLTFLSAVTGSVVLLFAGTIAAVLLAIGVAVRRRNKSRRTKRSVDACCQ